MARDDLIPAEGTIIDKQPNAFFKVRLENSEHVVLAMISGARELMTPGAWEKHGATYRLKEEAK